MASGYSLYTCQTDTTIYGTADVLLSNGKTEDTGYSQAQCEAECASKDACASFVYIAEATYCELWSKTTGTTIQSGYIFCTKSLALLAAAARPVSGAGAGLSAAEIQARQAARDATVVKLRSTLI